MTAETSQTFGWDDDVQISDSSGFTLLDEGPATFTVSEFKRGRFAGSARMAACYQAELMLDVRDASGNTASVRCNLPLNRKMAWKLTSIFKSTGLIDPDMPSGTSIRYPWDKLPGASGVCTIEHYDWTGDDGQVRTGNSIRSFLFGGRAEQTGLVRAAAPAAAKRPYGGTF